MPKELTHWIIAERALERLSPACPLGTSLRSHRQLYLAGAVLPDTLLHLVHGPGSRQALDLAHRFHDPGGNSYLPLIRARELHGPLLPPPLLACFMGVLCHMQADIVFHPFVYAHSGTVNLAAHYRLETAIDMSFLTKGIVPPVKRLDMLIDPAARETLITACVLLFDPEGTLSRGDIETAVKLHCRFQARYGNLFWKMAARLLGRLNIGRIGQRQHLFYPLISGTADMKLPEGTWRHPINGELREESVDDLAETAVRRTVDFFAKVSEEGFDALLAPDGENLLTGQSGVQRICMKSW